MKARPVVLIAAALVLLGGSLGYVLHARQRNGGQRLVAAESSFTLDEPGLYYRDTASGRVARSPGVPDGPSCVRFHAGETGPCACGRCPAPRHVPKRWCTTDSSPSSRR